MRYFMVLSFCYSEPCRRLVLSLEQPEPKACAFKRQENRFNALPFHRMAHLDLFCQGYTTVLNCTVPITTRLPQLRFLSVFLPVPVIFSFSLFCFVLPCFKPLQPLLMWICKSLLRDCTWYWAKQRPGRTCAAAAAAIFTPPTPPFHFDVFFT